MARQEFLSTASDVDVILHTLREIKCLAQFDVLELAEFTAALARVDSGVPVSQWPRSEPAVIGRWRQGVARRAESCAVAAAILYALEPYHALLSRAQPGLPAVARRLPTDRVKAVMRSAVMVAWTDQIDELAASDPAESIAWKRYQSATGPVGRAQDPSVVWRRGVDRRAKAGSDIATRVLDALRARDEALAAVHRTGGLLGTLFVMVPAASQTPGAAD